MYKVIEEFEDLQDNRYKYTVGMVYPRVGRKVSRQRLNELASNKNRRKIPMIKEVQDYPTDDEQKADEVEEVEEKEKE